jgi:hypothetical protein
MPHKHKTKVCA